MRVSPLFSTIFLFFFVFQLHAESGVISSVKNGTLTYFTPKAEYRVELASLPEKEREKVQAYLQNVNPNKEGVIPYVERTAIELEVGDQFLLAEKDEDGLRPNCNEIPVDPEEIIELANSFPKGGMVDFLNAIPEGSLQIFTMMKETKSKQHHEVSAKNPRIIRTNADGSFFMSFVCDPNSQDYGKVEIMTFDRSEDRFKMATIDFTNDPDSKIQTHDEMKFSHLSNNENSYKNQHRVNRNPKACLKCHSSDPSATIPDPRPLWQEYNTWLGAFGERDDVIDYLSDEEDLESLVELKKNNKDNPCFQSLPMPKELSEPIPEDFGEVSYQDDWIYPYQESRRNDYERRPNFRITDTLSRHAARRLGRKFYESPGYEKIKFESLMGTFNCPQINDYSKIFKESNPNYEAPKHNPETRKEERELINELGTFSPEIPRGEFRDFRELFELGKAYGFKNSDWTMNFNDEETNSYQAPTSDRTWHDGMGDLVQGDLFRRLANENPSLKQYYKNGADIERLFGEDHACIDEEVTPIESVDEESPERMKGLCAELDRLRKNQGHPKIVENPEQPFEERVVRCIEEQNRRSTLAYERDFVSKFSKVAKDDFRYDVGRSVSGICFECHSKGSETLPEAFAFFEDEESLKKELLKGPEFIEQTRSYINSGRMPKGIPLSDDERADFLYYIEQLYLEALTE